MFKLRQIHRLARLLCAAGGVTVLLTTGILITASSAAFATGDTVIGFDNLWPGTTVSHQYASQGITFDQAPGGPAGYLPQVQKAPNVSPSPPNVLNIEYHGLCGGNFANGLFASFAAPRNHVSLYVGDLHSPSAEQVTLSGYNQFGTPIPAATATAYASDGGYTLMSITDPNSQISFIRLVGPRTADCLAIDNLAFNQVSDAVTVTNPGDQASSWGDRVALQITAASTLGYPLTYSATGLPPGLAINSSTGLISGLFPKSLGVSTVTVTATDTHGASGSATFTWTGLQPPPTCKPRICP